MNNSKVKDSAELIDRLRMIKSIKWKNNQTFFVAAKSQRNFLSSIFRWNLFVENIFIFNLNNINVCNTMGDESLDDVISVIEIAASFTTSSIVLIWMINGISYVISFINMLSWVRSSMIVRLSCFIERD